jgi:hypothetical protein
MADIIFEEVCKTYQVGEVSIRAVDNAGFSDKVKYLQRGEIYSFAPRGMRQTVGQEPMT